MANMKTVNRAIKANFPNLDIEAVRGDGYVWFDGVHGADCINSIYVHPVTADTAKLISMCLYEINKMYHPEDN